MPRRTCAGGRRRAAPRRVRGARARAVARADDRLRAGGRHRHGAVQPVRARLALAGWRPPEQRPAAMSLYSALDDLGLTLGPALAGALLLVFDPHILMAINAGTFTLSAGLLATIPLERADAARGRLAVRIHALGRARDRRAARRAAAARLLDRRGDRGRHGQRRRGHARARAARRRRLRARRADDRLGHRHLPRLDLRRAHRHELAVAPRLHRRADVHGRRPRAVRGRALLLAAGLHVRARRLRQRARARPRPPAARPHRARAAARPPVRAAQDVHVGRVRARLRARRRADLRRSASRRCSCAAASR